MHGGSRAVAIFQLALLQVSLVPWPDAQTPPLARIVILL
jgi:hypothetical protein